MEDSALDAKRLEPADSNRTIRSGPNGRTQPPKKQRSDND